MWFLDFEASGLHASYPIEVGWCRADLTGGGSTLIRPPPKWLEAGIWDGEAEEVHLLKQSQLQLGRPPSEVVRMLENDLLGEEVFCDGLEWDDRWLRTLFAALPKAPTFALRSASEIFGAAQRDHELRIADLGRDAGLAWHLALDDAIRHALTLALVKRGDDRSALAVYIERARALKAMQGRQVRRED